MSKYVVSEAIFITASTAFFVAARCNGRHRKTSSDTSNNVDARDFLRIIFSCPPLYKPTRVPSCVTFARWRLFCYSLATLFVCLSICLCTSSSFSALRNYHSFFISLYLSIHLSCYLHYCSSDSLYYTPSISLSIYSSPLHSTPLLSPPIFRLPPLSSSSPPTLLLQQARSLALLPLPSSLPPAKCVPSSPSTTALSLLICHKFPRIHKLMPSGGSGFGGKKGECVT